MSSNTALELLSLGGVAGIVNSMNQTTVEILIGVVVFMFVTYVIFESNFTNSFMYRWLALLGIVLVLAGKVLSWRKARENRISYWWNIAYMVLFLVGILLMDQADMVYEKTGAALFLAASLIDIFVEVYMYTQSGKPAAVAEKEDEMAAKQPMAAETEAAKFNAALKKGEMNPMIPLAITLIGDVLLVGDLGYGLYQAAK